MQLSKNEMANMIKIIDASAEKGMFRGPELFVVGSLREKLVQLHDAPEQEQATGEFVIDTEK